MERGAKDKSKGLAGLLKRKRFLASGLMSGTSMDGVDAALVRMEAKEEPTEVELVSFTTLSYPEELRDSLMELAAGCQCTAEDVATLNTGVAVAFARSFFEVCREAGVKSSEVSFIGSHGQTIAHVPPTSGHGAIAGTLQIGSPGMIAALTGVTTVGDFRVGDIALGGQGAPLAPYVDYLLRRSNDHSRVILNIGGIANVTYLSKSGRPEDVIAFDTGPGNMVLDALFRALYPGEGGFDKLGKRARQGRALPDLVDRFLGDPFFEKEPPKSAGHREFGNQFAWEFLSQARRAQLKREDILASAVSLTTRSISQAIKRFIRSRGEVDQVCLSGGGSRNQALVAGLREALGPVEVFLIDELGVSAEAKEAVDFAVLAREALLARPNVIPSTTGASRETVLGTIALGSNLW